MPVNSATVYKAIEPVIRDHWGLWSKSDQPDAKRCIDYTFKTESTDEPIMDVQEWAGPGTATYKPEGARVVTDMIYQGVGKRFQSQTFAIGMEVTYEAAEDAAKNLPQIAAAGKALGESAWKTPDYLGAIFYDRAFNSAFPAFGNGTSLCSVSQVLPRGGTYANMFPGAGYSLSEIAIEQLMANLAVLPGSSGMIDPLELSSIVVHPSNVPQAWKLAKTQLKVGSGNNDLSFVYNGFEVISCPFLGSQTRWFALTNVHERGDGLNWKWRVKPEFRDDNEMLLNTKVYMMRFRAYWFCKNPRGIYGSNAT